MINLNKISKSLKSIQFSKRTFSSSVLASKKFQLSEPFNYENDIKYSQQDQINFWDDVATKYVHCGDEANPEWFKGGLVNACYNAVDVHAKDPITKNRIALIHETPSKDNTNTLTYGDLWDEVCTFSRGLQNLGVEKGDRVVIYMPMVNQIVIAMLACARLGAIHSVVFGGFASPQLAQRIEHSKPKVVISCSFGIEGHKVNHYSPLLEKALELSSHKPNHVIVYNRTDIIPDTPSPSIKNSIDWYSLIKSLTPLRDFTPVDSTHPLYILYTSGTTGMPKGVVRDTGGYMAAMNYAIRTCYDMQPGDTFFSGSDIGWVGGHTLSVYGPLVTGLTSIIFEGKPTIPDAGVYWKMIEKHRVKAWFSAPTAIRAIHRDDADGKIASKYDLSSLQSTWLGGERLDLATFNFLSKVTKKPILDNYWQTESGWPMITNASVQFPIKQNTTGKAFPGYNFFVLNSKNERLGVDQIGEVCAKLPVPPGFANTLYLNHEGYKKSYLDSYPGYLRTGDSGFFDKEGYFTIINRVDDFINVAGHRLSTGSIEEILVKHPKIVECVAIGVNDEIKGEVPFGLIVLKPQYKDQSDEIEKELIKQVRETIGPVATFKKVMAVNRLPKTRSGKILRNILKKMYNKEEYVVPPTIEDMAVLDEVDKEFEKYKLEEIEHKKHKEENKKYKAT
ncbi:hypothetical protein DICPUDRAFT_152291 [Dictyostelium purpureum]|uniref:Uncharacterized protein n=1 Tax=Dictyostelium purpureum TaxID=5786 RepID=F0ZKZ2_DICPU|nr:uncharacterized protein DICPUDRAFT_152291 [Dictyostelium purpureum]EGC35411.1 hypothetical protein DICPUDRAFT_152291 [Dictyostelium purpureum]|eukprot:XP_003288087.1 hypothetical protein DICPUDRAFT_152291 [Dictyostelium purpureum]